jgi:hypothetical protein
MSETECVAADSWMGRAKHDHDEGEAVGLDPPYFRNKNSRPIFTRFTPLYSMMSAVA